jgi:hypothetical protein
LFIWCCLKKIICGHLPLINSFRNLTRSIFCFLLTKSIPFSFWSVWISPIFISSPLWTSNNSYTRKTPFSCRDKRP